ncbi:hypothetical protein I5M27_09165 [Adhaeribacter sp. BT258]|uniref:Tissue inhibitor of metalloproteinase n=1 Tax=Adhaeribacter terrigena TaxID=2793070 RepID=A0ABS1C175_9BACT|nr:hypothetical protein [Adhaeribacter terrigena]MBK0403153.1 hypothetical protein [Adhaeribacter terrigena]
MKRLSIICAIVLLASNCFACRCWPKPQEIYKKSPFIFIGKVISIREDSTLIDKFGQGGLAIVEFEVQKYWKGYRRTDHSNKASLLTSVHRFTTCSPGFSLDSTYLVVDKPDNPSDIITTDLCMGTSSLSEAKTFLAYLDTISSNKPAYNYDTGINPRNELKVKEKTTRTYNPLFIGSLTLNGILALLLFINYRKRRIT